jgi:pimeloyl-ACP methyl ester carboxylesterase
MSKWQFHLRNTKKMLVLCFAILSLHKFLKRMAIIGLSERMYLKYLRTKFKTLALVSPATAGKIAVDLFCTPYPKYKKKKAPAIFHQATPLTVSLPDGIQLKGFEWNAQKSNNKTVLISHGYASYGYKFEQYVAPLLKMGYRVLIFDAPGHGLSQGKYIHILIYLNAIEHIIKSVGPVDHFIGHSLGGITLAMLAETIPNPAQHKFVLIAPATKTTTTFNNYFNMMRFSESIKTAFLDLLASKTKHPITYFEADRAIENYTGPVLWVHDAEDKVCPYKDLINFQEKAPKNINFLITNGLGHNKVYKTQAVIDKIMAFLAPED